MEKGDETSYVEYRQKNQICGSFSFSLSYTIHSMPIHEMQRETKILIITSIYTANQQWKAFINI